MEAPEAEYLTYSVAERAEKDTGRNGRQEDTSRRPE